MRDGGVVDGNEAVRADMEHEEGAPLGLLLLVLAVCAVVVVAAHGLDLLPPPLHLSRRAAALVRTGGALALMAGIAALVVQRQRIVAELGRKSDPIGVALRTAGLIMAALVILALSMPAPKPIEVPHLISLPSKTPKANSTTGVREVRPPRGLPILSGGGGSGAGGGQDGGAQVVPATPRPAGWSLLHWIVMAAFLLLLFFIAVVTYLSLTGRIVPGGHRRLRAMRLTAPQAKAGLEASLDAVALLEGEPRDRITAAYLRLLKALAAAGAPRRRQEAPHEYLRRVLGPLGVQPAPLHRLAGLYVFAQFSKLPVTERHRQAAAEALEVGLSGLRSVRGAADARAPGAGAGPSGPLPSEAPA